MRQAVFSVVILGAAAVAPGLSQTSQTQTKPASKTAKQVSAANKSGTRTASSRTLRGRSKYRRARVTAPAYQLHPDPERYQQIQQALAARGYFKGEANGTWGEDSVDALKRFQADQKLPDDGHISALSLISLGLGPRHDGAAASPAPNDGK